MLFCTEDLVKYKNRVTRKNGVRKNAPGKKASPEKSPRENYPPEY